MWRGLNWIYLVQNRDNSWALVNTDEHSGSIEYGEFIDYLRNSWLIKDSAALYLLTVVFLTTHNPAVRTQKNDAQCMRPVPSYPSVS
jgi:hypothetical protein